MRTSWRRRVLVLGSLGALTWGASNAQALGHNEQDAFVVAPTVYSEAVPTSYVVPTSYAIPTSYVPTVAVQPTSYLASSYVVGDLTSYVVPTVYATSYRVPRRFRARSYAVPTAYYYPSSYVATAAYYPTSYVVPTAYYPTTYVATSAYYVPTTYAAASVACAPDPCCATAAVVAAPPAGVAVPSRNGVSRPATPGGSAAVGRTPQAAADGYAEEDGGGVAAGNRVRESSNPPASIDSTVVPPPSSPAPEKDGAGGTPITTAPAPASPPGPASPPPSGAAKQAAPAVNPTPIEPAPGDETVRRDALKPVGPGRAPGARAARRGTLNVLEGKVVSADNGRFEEGVQVIVSNRLGTYADRVAMTDAFGRYAVRLPDGDWVVKVTMPSGRTYAVSQLVVSSGQISDDLGRNVPTLTITR